MNKPAGLHIIQPERCEIIEKKKQGFSFLAFSLDSLFLGSKIDTELDGLL